MPKNIRIKTEQQELGRLTPKRLELLKNKTVVRSISKSEVRRIFRFGRRIFIEYINVKTRFHRYSGRGSILEYRARLSWGGYLSIGCKVFDLRTTEIIRKWASK